MKSAYSGFWMVVGLAMLQSCATGGNRSSTRTPSALETGSGPLQETYAAFDSTQQFPDLQHSAQSDSQILACLEHVSDDVNSLRAHNPKFNSRLKGARVKILRAQIINADVGYFDPKYLSDPFISGDALVINAVMGGENTRTLDGAEALEKFFKNSNYCVRPSSDKIANAKQKLMKPYSSTDDWWEAESSGN
jgi:hypothetical protein